MKKFRPGVSFGDFVVSDSKTRKSLVPDEIETNFRKGWLIWMAVVVALGVLAVRLVTLQIVYGERYRLLSDQNRIKIIRLIAPRGTIFDRKGQIMAGNFKLQDNFFRVYLTATSSAHVIGTLGEVGENEVGLLKEIGDKYSAGDKIGRSGVEAQYEERLRGISGGRLVEVDNLGNVVRELGRKEPTPGRDLYMTLDSTLQKEGLEALGGKKGALVVSNPQTGEILALVSSPSYNPNLITTLYPQLVTREDLPLFDRAIGGIYPPGSTFKMVTTAAAISENKVKPGFTFNDQGIIRVGNYSYTNWLFTKTGGIEGPIGFARAITRSTDTFFYTVGDMAGPDVMAVWARKMGLGDKTNVDLPGEVEGVIPDPAWKEKTKGEAWFLGNSYQMAIGQGDVLTSPIQINLMTNVVATGGKKCQMHLTTNIYRYPCDIVPIAPAAVEAIHKGMVGACTSGGTAFPLFDWNDSALKGLPHSAFANATFGVASLPVIGCKTGTAEYMAADGKMRTHGWLTAYAPADNPVISVTVLMEGGGEGSNVAAPVVRKVMAKYFGVTDTYPYGAIKQEIGE